MRRISEQNVEVVRRAFEAFNRDGLDGLLEFVHPDGEYDVSAAIGPYAGIYYGRAAIRAALADYFETWEYVRLELADLIEVDEDHIVATFRAHARGKESGVEVEAQTTQIWTVHEGQGVRVAVYNDKAEALEAAGLKA